MVSMGGLGKHKPVITINGGGLDVRIQVRVEYHLAAYPSFRGSTPLNALTHATTGPQCQPAVTLADGAT